MPAYPGPRTGRRWALAALLGIAGAITLVPPGAVAAPALHWQASVSNLRGEPACVNAHTCFGVAGNEIVEDAHAATSSAWKPVFTSANSASVATTFTGVSCSLPGCVAIGNRRSTNGTSDGLGPVAAVSGDRGQKWRLVALPLTDGVSAPTVDVRAVSCGSATSCLVLGSAKGTSLAWSTGDGGSTWQAVKLARADAAADLTSVDCTSATFCVAGGNGAVLVTTTGPAGFSVARTPATWDLHTSSADYASAIDGITCVAHTQACVAVGYREITETFSGNMTEQPSHAPRPLIASSTGGKIWTDAISAPSTAGSLATVSCPALGTCVAGGYVPNNSGGVGPTELVASEGATSHWQTVAVPRPAGKTLLGIDGIACTSRLCIAGGATASLKVSTARYELIGPA